MKTKQINVYEFSELSEKSKKKALENYSNTTDYHSESETSETVNAFCNAFWVSLDWYDVYWVWYSLNNIEDDVLELSWKKLREYLLDTKDIQGKYWESIITKWYSWPMTWYYMDCDILEPIGNYIEKNDTEDKTTYWDLIVRCMNAFAKSVENDYTYQVSEEWYRGYCDANECEFTEDGELFTL